MIVFEHIENMSIAQINQIPVGSLVNNGTGEEPTMPTKDEIEQFIQSQLGKDKSKINATSKVTKIISGGQTGVDTIGLQVAAGETAGISGGLDWN